MAATDEGYSVLGQRSPMRTLCANADACYIKLLQRKETFVIYQEQRVKIKAKVKN